MEFWYELLRCLTESCGFGGGDLVFLEKKRMLECVFSGVLEHGMGMLLGS